jgi:hypothetical protein
MDQNVASGTISSLSKDRVEEATTTCFVCKVPVSKKLGNKSDEHVVSDWLIRDCGLSNKRITIPNGAQYSYTGHKVTCCLKCNSSMSDQFEQKIKRIFWRGYDKLRMDGYNRELLLSWMCKLRCAAATKCMSFYINPAHRNLPSGGDTITNDPQFIAKMNDTRLLLKKRIDQGGTLSDDDASLLGSVFVFKCKMEDDDPDKFYYSELHQTVPLAIFRYRDIGIVAFFEGGDEMEKILSEPPMASLLEGKDRAIDWNALVAARSMVISDEQLEEVASIIAHAAYLHLGLLLPDFLRTGRDSENMTETSIDTVFCRRDSFGFLRDVAVSYDRGLFLALICQNTYDEWWESNKSLLVQIYPNDDYFLHTKELEYTHIPDQNKSVINALVGHPIETVSKNNSVNAAWESRLSCAQLDFHATINRCDLYGSSFQRYENPNLYIDSGMQDGDGYRYYLAPIGLGYLSRGHSLKQSPKNWRFEEDVMLTPNHLSD